MSAHSLLLTIIAVVLFNLTSTFHSSSVVFLQFGSIHTILIYRQNGSNGRAAAKAARSGFSHSFDSFPRGLPLTLSLQQMMGPEAMGITQVNVDWWDPRVCRNFLCGTCPHEIFGNTVRFCLSCILSMTYQCYIENGHGSLPQAPLGHHRKSIPGSESRQPARPPIRRVRAGIPEQHLCVRR